MGGQGASVYPGVMAYGGALSLSEAGNLTVSGPLGAAVGSATVAAGGGLLVNGSAAISAAQTLSVSAAGTYVQSGGVVDAAVVSLTGSGGVTVSAGAIMGAGAGSSVSIGGGGFAQSGGTISATGAGASLVVTPSSFSQSGGVLSSDGDVRIGSGSNAGLASGVATATNGIVQSGGRIGAVGNLTLYSTGVLTQSAGLIAAGGTLAASVSGTISQGTVATTSVTTAIATLSGSVVRLFSTGGSALQGGDAIVAGTQGATIDPLGYPVRIAAAVGTNSFSVFGTAGAVTASGGFAVFAPSADVTASGVLRALPGTPSVSVAAVTAGLPDVVVLGDVIAPLVTGLSGRDVALYSRHDTTGKVSATLLTGRAGILTQDATNGSPYPLPDLVRAVEVAGLWSTGTAVAGNVALTGAAVANLGTAGFGYGATGGFSLANTAPGGTLVVMGGQGALVYPGVMAYGGALSLSETGQITVSGPLSGSTTLTLGAGADLVITGGAVLAANVAISLNTAGAYLQDAGLVNAPGITLASTKSSGTGIAVSGGTIGASSLLQITSIAGVSQSGGVIASDNALTIGSGSGAGSVVGVATGTTAITQTGGTMAAVGDLTLYSTGALTQTAGMIGAGGILAATAGGDIVQGNPALANATTPVARMTGSTVALFSANGTALQGGDGIVGAGQGASVDPTTYALKIQSPHGVNSFSAFGAPASVSAGTVAFDPAADVSASATYKPLTTYSPASVGAMGATLPDVVLLGDSIALQTTGLSARHVALYSRHTTQGLVHAELLTGRAGVLTSDSAVTPDFAVPAIVRAVEVAGLWSTAANITDGNMLLPNAVTNGSTLTVSAIQNLGTTVGGVDYGIGVTGSFNLDNKAPGINGTLTVAGGLTAWTGGVRIHETGTSDTIQVIGNINVASPGVAGVQASGTLIAAGLLSLTGNTVKFGKSGAGAGGSVTLQAAMLEVTGLSAINVLDGVTIDTGGDTFTRPLPGLAPKDPQKVSGTAVHMPGALFNAGLGGFTQTGTFTMQPYTPTAYTLSGALFTPATHPVLEIVLTGRAGTIAFDPLTSAGLAAPKVAVVTDVGAGNATGHIDADTLALFYTQQVGLPTGLFGTLRTRIGGSVSDQAAATQAFIAQNANYVPSNHFQMNGCALSSVNCLLTSLFPQGIVANPFRDLMIGRFSDPLDDPDLLLPNVSDRDY